ncbi:hypothetical protein L1887_36056 [Cichorium endivia]|nr:hypothetical protein L1887_36056 [Cichorium endivia]
MERELDSITQIISDLEIILVTVTVMSFRLLVPSFSPQLPISSSSGTIIPPTFGNLTSLAALDLSGDIDVDVLVESMGA